MPRKSRFVALAAALLAVTAAPALAGGTEQLTSSWANVNICNSGQLGARAQLAGDGSSDIMRVRFTAQWLSPDGWVPLAGQATSPWQDAGSATFTWAQAGWTFNLNVPAPDPTTTPDATAPPTSSARWPRWTSARVARSTQTTGACVVGG